MSSKRVTKKRIREAMKHPDVLGAGAKKRKHLSKDEKAEAIWREFKRGTLHSGSGEIVTSAAQARAIIASETGSKRRRKKK